MKLDHELLHKDVLIKLASINRPQRYLFRKKITCRGSFRRLMLGENIRISTLFNLLEFLDADISKYVIKDIRTNTKKQL